MMILKMFGKNDANNHAVAAAAIAAVVADDDNDNDDDGSGGGGGDGGAAYSIVVMDELFGLGSWRMRGSEAIGAIRALEARQAALETGGAIIIHLTGNADQLIDRCGADATWNKPFPKAADGSLRRALAQLLAEHRAAEEAARAPVQGAAQSNSPLLQATASSGLHGRNKANCVSML